MLHVSDEGLRWTTGAEELIVPWARLELLEAVEPWPSLRVAWRGATNAREERTLTPSSGGRGWLRERGPRAEVEIAAAAEQAMAVATERGAGVVRPGWVALPVVDWEPIDHWPDDVRAGGYRGGLEVRARRSRPSPGEALLIWLASSPSRPWRSTPRELCATHAHLYVERWDGSRWRIPLSALRARRGEAGTDAVYVFGRSTLLVLPARADCAVRALLDAEVELRERRPPDRPESPSGPSGVADSASDAETEEGALDAELPRFPSELFGLVPHAEVPEAWRRFFERMGSPGRVLPPGVAHHPEHRARASLSSLVFMVLVAGMLAASALAVLPAFLSPLFWESSTIIQLLTVGFVVALIALAALTVRSIRAYLGQVRAVREGRAVRGLWLMPRGIACHGARGVLFAPRSRIEGVHVSRGTRGVPSGVQLTCRREEGGRVWLPLPHLPALGAKHVNDLLRDYLGPKERRTGRRKRRRSRT